MYLLAKRKGINTPLALALLISYLTFYGIQDASWFDVHSLAFGASFLAWFIYFLDRGNKKGVFVSFFLTVICKEDMALLTLLVSFVYFVVKREKVPLYLMGLSALYLFAIFAVYFPYFTHDGYRYASKDGVFADVKLSYFYDTVDKRNVILYSLAWFGFLPLLAPLFLLPAFGDIAHYFLLGHLVTGAQGFYLHYRIALAPLLLLPTVVAISRMKLLNTKYLALYILLFTAAFQYTLHLPLSYLAKGWFWHTPASVKNINAVIAYLPKDASVVSQNNITPHIDHRDNIFTLWPEKKSFPTNSPCKRIVCNWFRWAGNPTYLVVDTSSDWDIRHFLANRDDYIDGLTNLKQAGVISIYKQQGEAVLYKVNRHP